MVNDQLQLPSLVLMKTNVLSHCIILSCLHYIMLSNSPIIIAYILLMRKLRHKEIK